MSALGKKIIDRLCRFTTAVERREPLAERFRCHEHGKRPKNKKPGNCFQFPGSDSAIDVARDDR